MEHRCGERLAISLPAMLHTPQGARLRCQVIDIGCGGAFVKLAGDSRSLRGMVELEFWLPYVKPQHCRWRAYVVHSQPDGIGLMFDDLHLGDLLPFLAAEKASRQGVPISLEKVSGERMASA